MKRMIRAHIDDNQDNWDLGLPQLVFSYNSSIHATTGMSPFEVMFGRQARIPIDLQIPNALQFTRESIAQKRTMPREELPIDAEVPEELKFTELDVWEDVTLEELETKLPLRVQEYVTELKNNMLASAALVNHNRDETMTKVTEKANRRIKKHEYNINDWVLCNHPRARQGMARGLAPKYYGPFVIVGKYANKCDYLIKSTKKAKARVKQVHQNNLKLYFKRDHPDDAANADQEGEEEVTIRERKKYTKDLNNKRWAKRKSEQAERSEEPSDSNSDTSEAENSYTDETKLTMSEEETESEEELAKKRKYTKNPNNKRWAKQKQEQHHVDEADNEDSGNERKQSDAKVMESDIQSVRTSKRLKKRPEFLQY